MILCKIINVIFESGALLLNTSFWGCSFFINKCRYDMYAGETRAGSSANPDVQQQGNGVGAAYNEPMPENAQAVEVVELANGEIIWCV